MLAQRPLSYSSSRHRQTALVVAGMQGQGMGLGAAGRGGSVQSRQPHAGMCGLTKDIPLDLWMCF